MISLEQAIRWTGAAPRGALPPSFPSVSTDTRALGPGCLFVALRGERFDGHRFAADAVKAGAGAVVAAADAALAPDLPALVVPDTAEALRNLAAGWRAAVAPRVLGVTGSAGKTTTKELCAHLLGALGPVARTLGNFNNSIGLPLSILAMPEDSRFGVFEAGTNHPGEIAPLAALMRPDAAVLVNVGPVHLGNFGGSERAIANEKADLLRAVPSDGFCVLDASGAHFRFLRDQCRAPVATVSPDPSVAADFRVVASDVTTGAFRLRDSEGGSEHDLRAPRPGAHQILDALLAVAAARRFGVSWDDISARLGSAPNAQMRWERVERDGVAWINDAYNANPLSMRRALETFASTPPPARGGRRIAVLGDMGELGEDDEERLHREVGRAAATSGLDALVCVGPRAEWIAAGAGDSGMAPADIVRVSDAAAAREALADLVRPGDLVLLKASRSMALERVLE